MRVILAEADPVSRTTLKGLLDVHPDHPQTIEAESVSGLLRALADHRTIRLAVVGSTLPEVDVQGLCRRYPELRVVPLSERACPGKASLPAAVARALADAAQGGCGLGAVLTPRERDIILLLREGLSNKVIANRLAVSEVTVKSHLGKVFRKLGVRNRLQALRLAVEAWPM